MYNFLAKFYFFRLQLFQLEKLLAQIASHLETQFRGTFQQMVIFQI